MGKSVKKSKRYSLYQIKWLDAKADGGWKHLSDDIEASGAYIHSAGWLIKETSKVYVLAQQMGSTGQYSDTITIPKGWSMKKTKMRGMDVVYNV